MNRKFRRTACIWNRFFWRYIFSVIFFINLLAE